MRNHAIAIILLPILLFFNAAIFQKEDLRANGDLIFLELAPVDPRSLMQGDYMQLRFQLVEAANKALRSQTRQDHAPARVTAIVMRLDAAKHASFVRLHSGEALASGEQLLAIQHHPFANPQEIALTPSSFFFQEGHAARYQNARFGLMRVSPEGAHLLVGLADSTGTLITP